MSRAMNPLEIVRRVHSHVPYAQELGMEVLEASRDAVLVAIPVNKALGGDTERGWWSTGAMTSLIDSACGVALHAHLGKYEPIATLDLRVDYLRPARSELPLRCRAECYRLTRSVAFLRAIAYQDDEKSPVAAVAASFMRLNSAAP
ncbi:MAG: PaaI family thioesterase [Nevskiales bacterium]